MDTAAIVQWQNAALWQRMSWVRTPLAAPIFPLLLTHPRAEAFAQGYRDHCEIRLPRASQSEPSPPAAVASPSYPPHLYVGTSGWAYPTWKPGFYPAATPARAFLNFYAAQLTSVEVNYTFRTLPTAAQLQGWLDATPPGFRFSFKAPQRITHFQRLRVSPEPKKNSPEPAKNSPEAEKSSTTSLAEFVRALAPAQTAGKLGPLLFQLPPNLVADTGRLAAFLEAPVLAADPSLQVAFEFRHASWFTEATYEVLRRYKAALCVAESDELSAPDIATARFHCYRLRRNGGYSEAELRAFAQRFAALAADGHEVFAYLKHEDDPTGALNARSLLQHAATGAARAHA